MSKRYLYFYIVILKCYRTAIQCQGNATLSFVEPISFVNVSIHPLEHIEVKHYFFESLFLRARSLKIHIGVNLFRKITGSQ